MEEPAIAEVSSQQNDFVLLSQEPVISRPSAPLDLKWGNVDKSDGNIGRELTWQNCSASKPLEICLQSDDCQTRDGWSESGKWANCEIGGSLEMDIPGNVQVCPEQTDACFVHNCDLDCGLSIARMDWEKDDEKMTDMNSVRFLTWQWSSILFKLLDCWKMGLLLGLGSSFLWFLKF